MSDHPRPTRLSRLLARCYPRELRDEYADEIARFIDDARRDPRNAGKPLATIGVAATLTRDALVSLFASLRDSPPRPIRRATQDVLFINRVRSYSMEALVQDIKYALRGFVRRPAFTAIAVATLALGIGGNSAVFTLVNAVLLKALPYPNPDRLVFINGVAGASRQAPLSAPDIEDLRRQNRTFEDIGIANTQSVNLTGGDRPDRVIGNFVSASSLRILGATTAVGRIFTDDETRIGAGNPVVVLSYATWRSRYGSRADIIGQKVILNGQPHTVIGVTSAAFRDPAVCDIWIPISSASRSWFQRNNPAVHAIGRLKAGVTLLDAEQDLGAIAKQLVTEHQSPNLKESVAVLDMRDTLVGGSRFTLIVLFGAVAAVLLIACVNIANLQLVRASTRQREMSIRAAMGANRTRLVSQTLVESFLLALVGGTMGIAVGQIAAKFLVKVMPPSLPLMGELEPDWRVVSFSFGIALLTGLLFGAPAAFAGTRTNLNGALRTRSDLASTGRFTVRNFLVISELALCVVLLAVAGLFTRTMQSLNNVDVGFNAEHVLSAEFRIPAVKYDNNQKVQQFMRSALERLRATPGVVHAAWVGSVPFGGNADNVQYVAEGQLDVSGDKAPSSLYTTISDEYFETMQIPQLAGRDFNSSDVMGSEPVAIINKTLADQAWPGQNAVGKVLRLKMQPEVTLRVVGVVGAAKQYTMTEEAQAQIYLSKEQYTGIFTGVVLRTTGDPDAMNKALHDAIWSVDRDQPIWKVRSMQFLVDRDLGPSRVIVNIVGAFALLALLLATIGVYGVMSFAVQQRSREMGIRMALGARTTQVLNLVLRSGGEVVLIALFIGLAGAMAAGKFVESRLYNVQPGDPATMIGVPLLLGTVALLACYLPARRAARVDPVVTLRSE